MSPEFAVILVLLAAAAVTFAINHSRRDAAALHVVTVNS
jgi:hypothetical protein